MALLPQQLTDRQSCLNFFEQQTLHQLKLWREHPAIQTLEIATLDRRRDSILSVISFGLKLQEAWPLVSALMLAFTDFMERRGYWQMWSDLLKRAIVMADRMRDRDTVITLTALLARLYNRQSRPKETIYHYRRVIRMARQAGNRFEEARACSNLGYIYTDEMGQWWRAEVLCCHALAIFEELGNEHGQAHTENHLGVLYTRQHMWDKAEHHLKQACAIWQDMEDAHSLIHGLVNLGMLYVDWNNPLEALIYLEKAVHQVTLTGEEAELGNIWNNMVIAHRQNGDLEQAKACAKQAEDIFRKFSNSLGLAQVWDNLGVVYLLQNKGKEAFHFLEVSLETYHHLNNWGGQIKVLLNIVEHELVSKNVTQTTLRLNELETLVTQHTHGVQQNNLRQRINEYHRRLNNLGMVTN